MSDKDVAYDIKLQDEYIRLIADFFQIPLQEVRERLDENQRQPGAQVAKAWNLFKPRTPDEVTRFYHETDAYVYDLAADHCRLRRQSVWNAVVQRIERRGPNQRVLLYGDGIGTDSIALARRGHHVSYFDLPGVTANLALFRFEREGLQNKIFVVERATDIPCKAFHAVVSIEVLEHVPDPLAVMRDLHSALQHGGIALITESFESVGPNYPSHLEENLQYAGRVHRMMEGLGFANTYYNTDPMNRPMEFTKIKGDVSGKILRLRCRLHRALDTRWRRVLNGHAFLASIGVRSPVSISRR